MASAALAQSQGRFTSANGTAQTLIGTETGVAGANAWTTFGGRMECAGSTFTFHKYNVTPHVAVANSETTFTVTPHYKTANSFSPEPHPGTLTMNRCDYVVHMTVTTGGVAGTFGVTVDILCPAGKVIEEHIYSDVAHTQLLCTLKVKGQTGLAGAHVTNTPASSDFDISGTIEKVHVEREGLCLLDGKGTTTTLGALDIDITIKSSSGVGIAITD
jgi:hypothetical protein